MEKNSFSNSLRDHSVGNKPIKDNGSSNSYKQLQIDCGEDYLSGFSWPPRSYTCSFCKREFRSAQALGGHMNVHRRDRARLRQSPPTPNQPPFLNLNLKPNPNPNPNFPSLIPPPLSYAPSYSPSTLSSTEMKKWRVNSSVMDDASGSTAMKNAAKSLFAANDFGCNKFLKKTTEYVRLDLEIGLVSDSKEDLDLELRLGYS